MPILPCRCLLIGCIALAGAFLAPVLHGSEPIASSAPSTPAEIIAALEHDDSDDAYLYDMHGNADQRLQQLMVLRFDATAAVMQAIDRLEGDRRQAKLRAALYDVLGFVKDPASIDWLRTKVYSDTDAFYRDYLPAWRGTIDGFGSWEWLTGRNRWIAFWREAFDGETLPERRIELLCVLCQFDDPSVVSFFETRRSLASDPKEVLLTESYLDSHDVRADDKRVQWAVDSLARSPGNRDFLITMARHLRHKAFVSYLVDNADAQEPNAFPPYYHAERALQAITFECAMHGKVAWQRWYAAHGQEDRHQWTERATSAFREKLARNPVAAANEFDHVVYCWNEIALLPFVETELARHTELHSAIAGWINLTYTDAYRERLRPLAERIGKGGHIDDVARRLLQERGYLPGGRKRTWAETVEVANMRV